MLVWAKEDPVSFCGTHYLIDKEYCLYFWEQGAEVHIPYERGKTVFISKKNVFDFIKKHYDVIKKVSGVILIGAGLYMIFF